MQKHEDFRREALDVVTVFLSLPIAGDNWSPPNCFMVPVSISLLIAELCFMVRVTTSYPKALYETVGTIAGC